MPLTLQVQFPLGQFHAHDGRGNAEWPPHPARLAAAILSTAYTIGDPDAVRVARGLYGQDAPTITTSLASERHTAYVRWVPVDVPLEVTEKKVTIGRGGLAPKIAKPPERGTLTTGALTYTWPTSLTDRDEKTLDRVLLEVPYLGRPTSPVIIDRSTMTPDPQHGQTVWEPDPEGTHRLGVATPALLHALDSRERERELVGVTGHHPRLGARPTARYRATRVGDGPGVVCEAASQAQMAAAVASLAFWRTPGAAPEDAAAVLEALEVDGQDGVMALPVFGVQTRQGLETARMFGVLTQGVAPRERFYVRGRQVQDLLSPAVGAPTASSKRAVRQAWGTAHAWTTTVPVTGDRERLSDELQEVAAALGTGIVDAQLHVHSRDPHGSSAEAHPALTHFSVLFTDAVSGPVVHHGVVLKAIPIQPGAQ